MEAIVRHLVEPIVDHPEAIVIRTVEGDATVILEMSVHDDDRVALEAEDGQLLRAVRTLLSAAAGNRKATIDLVQDAAASDEE